MKIILVRIFSLIFIGQMTISPVLAATLSLQAPDVEPPTIVFDVGNTEIKEGIKTFTARVTDNVGVATVTLYFKGATDIAFKPREMKRSRTDPDIYSVDLTMDPVISDKLEIYIRADDVSGNSIFEGQKFSPFAYTVLPAAADEVITSVTGPPVEEEEGMSTWVMVLIGLGVAALAGGGGGNGNGGGTGTVTVIDAVLP